LLYHLECHVLEQQQHSAKKENTQLRRPLQQLMDASHRDLLRQWDY
jgi:hypothetical protein